MLNLSIMRLDENHIDEICEDIIAQQRDGVSTHVMFIMTLNPEYTPAINKAEEQCRVYDLFRERLDKAGAKHGILAQATLGHITKPREPYEFQPTVNLITGAERPETCCPLDSKFHEYIKEQMKIIASHNPSIIMLDDDMGLLYKETKGCACKHHMAEFNRRAGTNMTREELYRHTQGNTEEDKYYTQIYVDVQRDGLVSAAKAMREGIDEVNPKIQGASSGIYVTTYCEFSGDIARAIAGEGNPAIIRLNGGPYSKSSKTRTFTDSFFRAAILRENTKDKVDVYLAETDTCAHNRYSTSTSMLHAHFTASILEGATGAKHWITRAPFSEMKSGHVYRKTLSKYSKFYEKMAEYKKELKPFGCRMPLTLKQNYGFVPATQGLFVNPWSTCVLERLGLPVYFSNDDGGVVFLDDISVDGFDDAEIKKFMSGTLVLSAIAADKLNKRGFIDSTGVEVSDWTGKKISGEIAYGARIPAQYGGKALKVCGKAVESLSDAYHLNKDGESEIIFPAVTRCKNSYGGETVVFSGTPDFKFRYYTTTSMLNETRKRQFIDIVSKGGNLPVYYPDDAEVYLRAGYLDNGEIMATFFNLSFDQLDEVTFVCEREVSRVEMLTPDGERKKCEFTIENGVITIPMMMNTLIPVVLFIS